MRPSGPIVVAAIAGWLLAMPASAASFVLADGETIEGAIVDATHNTIVIRRAAGGMRQIPIGRLRRVRVTTADGQTLSGSFHGWQDGHTAIVVGSDVVWTEQDQVVERAPLARRTLAKGGPAAAPSPAAPAAPEVEAARAPAPPAAQQPTDASSPSRPPKVAAAQAMPARPAAHKPAAAPSSPGPTAPEATTAQATLARPAAPKTATAPSPFRTPAPEVATAQAMSAPPAAQEPAATPSPPGAAVREAAVVQAMPARAAAQEPAAAPSPAKPAAQEVAAARASPEPADRAAPEPAAGAQSVALPAGDLPVLTVKTLPDEVTRKTAEVVFTVELSRPLDDLLVLIYSTVDGTAHAGTDYAALQGILTLPAGTTRSEIRTAILDEGKPSGDKDFNLFLAADPGRTKIAEPWTRVTIHDAN
jgi:RNase P/RNase MRP subunit p29